MGAIGDSSMSGVSFRSSRRDGDAALALAQVGEIGLPLSRNGELALSGLGIDMGVTGVEVGVTEPFALGDPKSSALAGGVTGSCCDPGDLS